MSQPVENAAETAATETTENSQATSSQESSTKLSYEQMETELKKVRSEAASRRVALREQEEAAKKWAEYEESQKTELQKLQDQLAEKDKAINETKLEATRVKIAKKFNVADDDLDLLVGDEANMERLAARLGVKETSGGKPADLLAGDRGTPIGGSANTFTMDDFIRGTIKQ